MVIIVGIVLFIPLKVNGSQADAGWCFTTQLLSLFIAAMTIFMKFVFFSDEKSISCRGEQT